MITSRARAIPLMASLLLWGPAYAAHEKALPGQLQVTQDGAASVSFDLDALDAFEQVSFETGTIWTDGTSRFSGVPVAVLLAAAGFEEVLENDEARLELVALNDYRVSIPMAEIGPEVPIVATRIDGEPMPIREKGPYWLIFPYDHDPRYRTEDSYKRSIWQLVQMVVTE